MKPLPNPMDPAALDALAKLHEAATAGPLVYDERSQKYQANQRIESADVVPMDGGGSVASLHITAWKPGPRDARPNARYLAALWNAAPELLRLARLGVEAEELKALGHPIVASELRRVPRLDQP